MSWPLIKIIYRDRAKQKKADVTPTRHNCVEVSYADLESDPEISSNIEDDCLDDIDNIVDNDETDDSTRIRISWQR